jgi:hypothetical protein
MTQMTEIAYKYPALPSRDFGQLRRTPFHISSDMSSTDSSDKGGLLGQLGAAVTAQQAAFCCGGTLQIAAARGCIYEHVTADAEPLASPPVVIPWDLPSGKSHSQNHFTCCSTSGEHTCYLRAFGKLFTCHIWPQGPRCPRSVLPTSGEAGQ